MLKRHLPSMEAIVEEDSIYEVSQKAPSVVMSHSSPRIFNSIEGELTFQEGAGEEGKVFVFSFDVDQEQPDSDEEEIIAAKFAQSFHGAPESEETIEEMDGFRNLH